VLFGDYNPAGRLTQTWVASMDQLPPMMDYDIRHGRTYLYLSQKPLYAFGFGLSYTTFAYSNLRFSSTKMDSKGEVSVSVDVKNAGNRAGDEVVQLYVTYPNSSVERPLEELKGFARISLKAGETKTVPLRLPAKSIAYWKEEAGAFVVEPGPIEVRIGSSSDNIKLRGTINISR
jgi:beta-glucosidase